MNTPIAKDIFFNGVLAIGLFLGIAGTLLFLIIFGFLTAKNGIDAGFSGTIIGAILGGGIAIVGQLFVLIESRSKFLEEKKDTQTRLLLTLLQSMSDIGSSLKGLKAHLDEGRADAKEWASRQRCRRFHWQLG